MPHILICTFWLLLPWLSHSISNIDIPICQFEWKSVNMWTLLPSTAGLWAPLLSPPTDPQPCVLLASVPQGWQGCATERCWELPRENSSGKVELSSGSATHFPWKSHCWGGLAPLLLRALFSFQEMLATNAKFGQAVLALGSTVGIKIPLKVCDCEPDYLYDVF